LARREEVEVALLPANSTMLKEGNSSSHRLGGIALSDRKTTGYVAIIILIL
jgi:hypothetical protein